ncbi:MAG: UDP-2,3-diacylglucosamine hydrolase [Marivirga sp.]|jgi:UDP-2,3-diacylglucosamine hydrolase
MHKNNDINISIKANQKIYFASDFHLGAPNKVKSLERERKIIAWLDSIQDNAAAIFLVGDLFDFWHEYKSVVPKGYIRFLGKLAELSDKGIPLFIFTGNHDMWMYGYFTEELNIPVFRNPRTILANQKKIYVGHGDGLGPGDHLYKFLKKVFENKFCQWAFRQLHPDLGTRLANGWSSKSRASSAKEETAGFLGEGEWLWSYAKQMEKEEHHDYYIFGHRHLPIEVGVGDNSKYINLGEWMNYCTYASFDGKEFALLEFKGAN